VPASPVTSSAFFDLVKLVGDESVSFAMDPNRSLFIRRLCQAEDFARSLIQLVLDVLHSVLRLHLQVFPVGTSDRLSRRTAHGVNIHE
jgi:hypothetical protein